MSRNNSDVELAEAVKEQLDEDGDDVSMEEVAQDVQEDVMSDSRFNQSSRPAQWMGR